MRYTFLAIIGPIHLSYTARAMITVTPVVMIALKSIPLNMTLRIVINAVYTLTYEVKDNTLFIMIPNWKFADYKEI
jgi:hypothetical protein